MFVWFHNNSDWLSSFRVRINIGSMFKWFIWCWINVISTVLAHWVMLAPRLRFEKLCVLLSLWCWTRTVFWISDALFYLTKEHKIMRRWIIFLWLAAIFIGGDVKVIGHDLVCSPIHRRTAACPLSADRLHQGWRQGYWPWALASDVLLSMHAPHFWCLGSTKRKQIESYDTFTGIITYV